ncbi:MAG TPA: hypothetical protein VLA49_16590, partial [Anaerolineales bacterium]|nr:hypothetical protein [Anaerolineales bacterium]
RIPVLMAVILVSLVLASGVLAVAKEDEAQPAPGSQYALYQPLAEPGGPVAQETGLEATGVITPTYVYPGASPVPPPAPAITPAASPAFVYPDLSQDSSSVPDASTPVTPTTAYPGNGQGPSSELAIDAFETHNCNDLYNPIVNCSFETGDFTGWIAEDMAAPYFALGVYPAGVSVPDLSLTTQPTQGSLVMANGFDGGGPDQISLAQDVFLPADSGYLRFDYRLAWDMYNYSGSTLDREFRVEVQPDGGGPALQETVVLTAPAGTSNTDTGNLTGRVDVSSFDGQPVRIKFIWNVPEDFTGPAFFQLDNIDIVPVPHDCSLGPNPIVNCSFETGDFTGWIAEDMAAPYFALGVYPAGVSVPDLSLTTKPTQGDLVLANGFDGEGPDQISLAQDLFLPVGSNDLRFDYRLAWDLRTYGATMNREFRVEVQPYGGGPALQETVVLTAPAGTTKTDSGYLTGRVDVSGFAGQPVRIKFIWNVPEYFTGPALFQLDNIDIVYFPRLFLPVIMR